MPLVSVIIPVYNAANYLAVAIRSIISQTIGDWETILIDDGSTDHSLSICREFAAIDNRIIIVENPQNLGPAESRNIGILRARGKYLAFLDSDDTYQCNALEKLVYTAEQFDADIVWCNYNEYIEQNHPTEFYKRSHNLPTNVHLNKQFLLSQFFQEPMGLGSLWNKLYRREFVTKQNLLLNKTRVRAEDWEFNLMAFQYANIVVAIDDYLYNYLRRQNSVMSTYRKDDYLKIEESYNLLQKMATEYDLQYDKKHYMSIIIIHYVEQICLAVIKESSKVQALKLRLNTNLAKQILIYDNIQTLSPFYKLISILLSLNMNRLAIFIILFKCKIDHK